MNTYCCVGLVITVELDGSTACWVKSLQAVVWVSWVVLCRVITTAFEYECSNWSLSVFMHVPDHAITVATNSLFCRYVCMHPDQHNKPVNLQNIMLWLFCIFVHSNVVQSVAVCPVVPPFKQLDPNLPDTHGNIADTVQVFYVHTSIHTTITDEH